MEVENLREQLASAVRSIQWSYAIFWSPSSQPGALEWGEGYYNGDIKTRKTILAMENMNNDQMSCQRSDQLRELYESLLTGTTNSGGGGGDSTALARRPSAALSPEDLTNAEWYYLVCMSFIFNIGQGLPGRSLANGQHIWLPNAHSADTSFFCRSLLAKSAGIKTVVCFPFLSGVFELGATDLVQEDLELIHHVKTTFLELSSYEPHTIHSEGQHYSFAHFRTEVLNADLPPLMQHEDMGLAVSPMASYSLLKGSQAQSLNVYEDDLSNCVNNNSMTSSDCVSQTLVILDDNNNPCFLEEELFRDHLSEDLHYQSILLSIFKNPLQMDLEISSVEGNIDHRLSNKGSSFVRWENGGRRVREFSAENVQKMLKAILIEVPRLHEKKGDHVSKKGMSKEQEGNEPIISSNHVLAERRRREKVNERFSVLKSIIPSTSKGDKVSILDDTISYLKDLERRVQELESCQELVEFDKKAKKRPLDMEERTSDNYGDDMNVKSKNEKRARGNDEGEQVCNQVSSSNDNIINVSMIDKDASIDIRCPWKETLFLDIIDTLSNLHLDSHTVQSSTTDGILSLTVKSKVRGCNSMSVGMITQALQKVLKNC